MLSSVVRYLGALLLLVSVAHAQFQFFDHMFGGGQERQQASQQNVPSDSSRYQSMWEGGTTTLRYPLLHISTIVRECS
jgi:hypothetical protein